MLPMHTAWMITATNRLKKRCLRYAPQVYTQRYDALRKRIKNKEGIGGGVGVGGRAMKRSRIKIDMLQTEK